MTIANPFAPDDATRDRLAAVAKDVVFNWASGNRDLTDGGPGHPGVRRRGDMSYELWGVGIMAPLFSYPTAEAFAQMVADKVRDHFDPLRYMRELGIDLTDTLPTPFGG